MTFKVLPNRLLCIFQVYFSEHTLGSSYTIYSPLGYCAFSPLSSLDTSWVERTHAIYLGNCA